MIFFSYFYRFAKGLETIILRVKLTFSCKFVSKTKQTYDKNIDYKKNIFFLNQLYCQFHLI